MGSAYIPLEIGRKVKDWRDYSKLAENKAYGAFLRQLAAEGKSFNVVIREFGHLHSVDQERLMGGLFRETTCLTVANLKIAVISW
jgi:hypothetical protein